MILLDYMRNRVEGAGEDVGVMVNTGVTHTLPPTSTTTQQTRAIKIWT